MYSTHETLTFKFKWLRLNIPYSIEFHERIFENFFFSSKHKKKKSKSLSEVKSFSSFSFSDVALDYKGM